MSLIRPVSTLVFCLCLLVLLGGPTIAFGQPDPGQCTVQYTGTGIRYDPAGASNTFGTNPIIMTLRDATGAPITGLVGTTSFEIDAWSDLSVGPRYMSDVFFTATGLNDIPPSSLTETAPGVYRLDGPILAGMCPTGFFLRVQGVVINTTPIQLSGISPDVNGDLMVNLVDFADFAAAYVSYATYTGACGCDYNYDGICNLADLGIFAQYYGLTAPPGAIVDPVD